LLSTTRKKIVTTLLCQPNPARPVTQSRPNGALQILFNITSSIQSHFTKRPAFQFFTDDLQNERNSVQRNRDPLGHGHPRNVVLFMKLLKFFGPVQMTRGVDDTKDWNHEYHDTPRHFSEHGKKNPYARGVWS
jgi:hypothetical protein